MQAGATATANMAQIDDGAVFSADDHVGERENSAQAVQETYGCCFYYNENPIAAYYFTSCGTTSPTQLSGTVIRKIRRVSALSESADRQEAELSFASEEPHARSSVNLFPAFK